MSFMDHLENLPLKRRFALDNEFFEAGDSVYNDSNKYPTMDDDKEFTTKEVPEFCCHIAGCMVTFISVQQYETHYNSLHRHVCNDCKKMFPTNHLLEIHMMESHCILFTLLAQKQNMYQCLVEGCTSKFKDEDERKRHLRSVHHYPADFRFGPQTKKNLKKTYKNDSMDTQSKNDSADAQSMEVTATAEATEVMDEDGISVKYDPKIPKEVCFGRGTGRAFMPKASKSKARQKAKGKQWHQKSDDTTETSVNIEEVSMDDLQDALPKDTSESKSS